MLPEVVLFILQHLYNQDRNTFLICMRVCNQWHDLALPILWKNIFLRGPTRPNRDDESALHHFIKVTATADASRLPSIRSLTALTRLPNNQFRIAELFRSFCATTLSMKNLESFSLTITLNAHLPNHGDVAKALQSFPTSLKCLEIIRRSKPSELELMDKHIAFQALAELLPQLKSLSLDGTRVCPGLFKAIATPCELLSHISITHKHDLSRCECEADRSTWRADPEGRLNENTIEDILEAAKGVIENGYLPRVENFTIVGFVHENDRMPSTFQNLYKADIVKGTVTSYPCADDFGSVGRWMRYLDPRTKVEVDLIAPMRSLMDLVSDTSWVGYNNNSRLPAEIKASSYLTREGDSGWYVAALAEAQRFRDANKPSSELHYWEDKTQRSLLQIHTSDELVVPRVIERERPIEEKQLDPDSEEGREPKQRLHCTW